MQSEWHSESMTSHAVRVSELLFACQHKIVVAESCTGGWLAKVITDISGSSAWFDRGFVTYSNQSKQDMLGVSHEAIARFGAVSEVIVAEMVLGALRNSQAQCAVAISGVAGPSGGTPEKPVGTVCLAWQLRGASPFTITKLFIGDRDSIREQAVSSALQSIIQLYSGNNPAMPDGSSVG